MKRKPNKTGRGGNALSDFAHVERYIMRSSGWAELRAVDQAAYLQFAFRYNGGNNGRILMSTKMLAEALHVSKASASRVLKRLTAFGFIEMAKGASFNSKIRHCAEWRLTAFRCDVSGALPAKTFTRYQPQIQKSVSPGNDTVSPEIPRRNKGPKNQPDGFTTDTVKAKVGDFTVSPENHFYNSYHTGVETNSAPSAGPAHPEAGAKRELEFQTLGNIALKSLAQLDADLPDRLKSWASTSSNQKLARAA